MTSSKISLDFICWKVSLGRGYLSPKTNLLDDFWFIISGRNENAVFMHNFCIIFESEAIESVKEIIIENIQVDVLFQ